jgi:putative ABC transport system ATP-binding protein
MKSMVSILTATGIDKTVSTSDGELQILRGIDLEIKSGEALAVVGASGSGKSTLLAVLAGLDLPSRGQVLLDGTDITAMDEDARALMRGRMVGFVFQSFHLLPGLTALENVMLPIEIRGDERADSLGREYLQRVGLAARLSHYPRQLSGGEQQRVAIARAFASSPRILFADEPTGNLDTGTGARVIDLLFALNSDSDTTLVLVTHDERLAARCSRRLRLEAGEIQHGDISVDPVA